MSKHAIRGHFVETIKKIYYTSQKDLAGWMEKSFTSKKYGRG